MAGICEGGNEPPGSLKARKGRKRGYKKFNTNAARSSLFEDVEVVFDMLEGIIHEDVMDLSSYVEVTYMRQIHKRTSPSYTYRYAPKYITANFNVFLIKTGKGELSPRSRPGWRVGIALAFYAKVAADRIKAVRHLGSAVGIALAFYVRDCGSGLHKVCALRAGSQLMSGMQIPPYCTVAVGEREADKENDTQIRRTSGGQGERAADKENDTQISRANGRQGERHADRRTSGRQGEQHAGEREADKENEGQRRTRDRQGEQETDEENKTPIREREVREAEKNERSTRKTRDRRREQDTDKENERQRRTRDRQGKQETDEENKRPIRRTRGREERETDKENKRPTKRTRDR
ncbi:hypothetical protein ANN_08297 [Periplaneta americana]|uniref:Uncharacterized protein n=1 Tax=Periplaneta americana TaxID=6978 RepID=A0ABQ8T113_PERAM|nr:hypothetical protein ANN_08297 [Periplaneta americana]